MCDTRNQSTLLLDLPLPALLRSTMLCSVCQGNHWYQTKCTCAKSILVLDEMSDWFFFLNSGKSVDTRSEELLSTKYSKGVKDNTELKDTIGDRDGVWTAMLYPLSHLKFLNIWDFAGGGLLDKESSCQLPPAALLAKEPLAPGLISTGDHLFG